MEINWEEVDELVKPSPNYETLVNNLLNLFPYEFVREFYSLDMNELREYTKKLLGQDSRQRYTDYILNLNLTFLKVENVGINSVLEIVYEIDNKEKLAEFSNKNSISIQELIRVLKYLFNWFFPSKTYLREIIDKEEETHIDYVKELREFDVRFTLDIIELGRTKSGREELSKKSNIPMWFILDLVNRADFTRMPYIRGSTIKHYFNIGYNSIEKLSEANLEQLESEMKAYLEEEGIKLSRSFIELDSGIEIAKILPKIIEH
jgi:hypothetical protein